MNLKSTKKIKQILTSNLTLLKGLSKHQLLWNFNLLENKAFKVKFLSDLMVE
jgi:hypothetical protein